MWLSHSFSLCLGFHLILAALGGILTVILRIYLNASGVSTLHDVNLPWVPFCFLGLGIALWNNHRRVRAAGPDNDGRNRSLWIKSVAFMVAAISYYPFGLREQVTIPHLQPPEYWTLFFMPLILPIYMLILSSVALALHSKAAS